MLEKIRANVLLRLYDISRNISPRNWYALCWAALVIGLLGNVAFNEATFWPVQVAFLVLEIGGLAGGIVMTLTNNSLNEDADADEITYEEEEENEDASQ